MTSANRFGGRWFEVWSSSVQQSLSSLGYRLQIPWQSESELKFSSSASMVECAQCASTIIHSDFTEFMWASEFKLPDSNHSVYSSKESALQAGLISNSPHWMKSLRQELVFDRSLSNWRQIISSVYGTYTHSCQLWLIIRQNTRSCLTVFASMFKIKISNLNPEKTLTNQILFTCWNAFCRQVRILC